MRDYTVIAAAFDDSALASTPSSVSDYAHGPALAAITDAASADAEERIRAITDCPVRVVPVLIPPTFAQAWDAVETAIAKNHPDVVALFGYAPGAHGVELERYAMNHIDVARTDAAGTVPSSSVVINGSPAAYWTRLPLHHILSAFAAQSVPAAVTSNAGDFLRNAVFYRILDWCARTPNALGGLMELPDVRDDGDRTNVGITAEQMRKACEQLIAQTVLYCSDMASGGHIIVEKRR